MRPKLLVLLIFVLMGSRAFAQLSIPSDGSDGDFNPTANVTVDLSQAVTGSWNSPGNGTGVYDPSKWAVVYKFRSINIPSGVTVTFKNHPSRAPVVWLVNGNVSITGLLSLNGQDGTFTNAEPGPGGFRSGIARAGTRLSGGGLGPGGADRQGTANRSGGSYATKGFGTLAGDVYGNAQIVPLIGGSGGAGRTDVTDFSGGAGGGAILIAASGTITVNGRIQANGGSTNNQAEGGGSGGAIRLVGNIVQGAGTLWAFGSNPSVGDSRGGLGRIRVEGSGIGGGLIPNSNPVPSSSIPNNPVLIWPPNGAPTVRVVSVGSRGVPADPRASLTDVADVSINDTNAISIVLETENVPPTSIVTIRVVPFAGDSFKATASIVSGDFIRATWSVSVALPRGFAALQAKAEVK